MRQGTPITWPECHNALHLTIVNGHREVAAILLRYTARLNIRDRIRMMPLQLAENIKNREIDALIKQYLTGVWLYQLISCC